MPVLGITGGIASGKTTFGKLIRERIDTAFFDTDQCARLLLDQDPAVREEILQRIHPEAYTLSDGPNRALLRDLIYHDPAQKKTLESILHPRIRQQWVSLVRDARTAGTWLVVDIPLLMETQAEAFFDHIVAVACSLQTQLVRMATRGLPLEISEKIIASQMPIEVKIKGAHHVIWNDGPLESLNIQADLFSSYLHARYG